MFIKILRTVPYLPISAISLSLEKFSSREGYFNRLTTLLLKNGHACPENPALKWELSDCTKGIYPGDKAEGDKK